MITSVGSEDNIDDRGISGLYRFSVSSLPAAWSANTVLIII